MAKVMLLHYNNYYNKEVKRENSVEDYRPYRLSQNYASSEWNQVAFNPNDSITTTIVLNWFGEQADYCIISEDGVTVNSRWFVLEAVRDLKGQYTYTLKRDVLADYLEETLNATAFIRKGVVDDSSPLAFIPEDVSLNRIKTRQVPLYDESGCPWVVIYYDKKYLDGTTPETPKKITWISASGADYTFKSADEMKETWKLAKYFENPTYYIDDPQLKITWTGKVDVKFSGLGGTANAITAFKMNGRSQEYYPFADLDTPANIKNSPVFSYATYYMATVPPFGRHQEFYLKEETTTNFWANIFDQSGPYYYPLSNGADLIDMTDNDGATYRRVDRETHYELYRSNGKVVYIANEDAYYQIKCDPPTSKIIQKNISNAVIPAQIKNAFTNAVEQVRQDHSDYYPTAGASTSGEISIEVLAFELNPYLTPISSASRSITKEMDLTNFTASTTDAPYNIIAIPYSDDFEFKNPEEPTKYIKSSKQLALDLGSQITSILGSNIYDVQLVPYFPLDTVFIDGKDNNIYTSSGLAQYIYGTGGIAGIAYNLPKSQFEKHINTQINILSNHATPKFIDSCYTVRLNSPNYASIYEYSPAKNRSILTIEQTGATAYCAGPFTVYCTLKPYSPYIQVWPDVGNDSLYGTEDFTDARGLICSGDFSLTTLSSAWTDYIISNKNFNEIFDRQIEKMDVDYKLSQTSKGISMASGLVGSGIGLATSAATGNVVGALASGAGMINSLGSGIGQMVVGKKQHEADKQYNITQHNLQLGNIQAMPNSISKISGINVNNLGVPILEVYECTYEEKELFSLHQIYEGMNVGAVGTLKDYIKEFVVYGDNLYIPGITTEKLQTPEGSYSRLHKVYRPFIQADIMRLTDIKDDTHVVNAIAEEVANGFYINTNLL